MRDPEHDELADALAFIMDGESLTTTRHWHDAFQRRRKNRELRVERACWLRAEGASFYRIGRELGIATVTAQKYVAAAAPELMDHMIPRDVGKPPGKYGFLSDEKLRALHRLHITLGVPASELARRIWRTDGYASWHSARASILYGWRRLDLRVRPTIDSRRHCSALAESTGRRCTRWALIGGEVCEAHRKAAVNSGPPRLVAVAA